MGIISKEASSFISPLSEIPLAAIPITSLLLLITGPPLSPCIIEGGTIILFMVVSINFSCFLE